MFRATLVALALLVIAPSSMAKNIFIQSHNATSDRLAVFEDDEKVAYLYLTKPGTQMPEKDAIAYSRIALVEKVDWKKTKKTGDAPSLSKSVASRAAIIKNPEEGEFSFKWSADGQSVALLRKGEPIALASATEKLGYSKAVAKPSRLANPWNQKRYEALFGKSP
jgi:hypothetical protein